MSGLSGIVLSWKQIARRATWSHCHPDASDRGLNGTASQGIRVRGGKSGSYETWGKHQTVGVAVTLPLPIPARWFELASLIPSSSEGSANSLIMMIYLMAISV